MEPKPLRVAHPVTYIVDHSVRRLPRGAWGVDPGGGPGVQISSASYGLNAVPHQFVLPLEAAQKGPFFRTPSLGVAGPTLNFFFVI
jgi:hypothetical protein